MSAPYLNRGETIILTTHRVSVGNTEYDAILTTERLILMDRRYTRFEPRMILFPAIVTAKSGRVPAGDPAIVLTLEQPSDITDSDLINIIFLQGPGEDRRSERDQWVKELVTLVISAREHSIQKQISGSAKEKSGVQPTVRRWVAPESPLPHTTHESPSPAVPEPEVIAEGPDPMEFFLEVPTPLRKPADTEPGSTPHEAAPRPQILSGGTTSVFPGGDSDGKKPPDILEHPVLEDPDQDNLCVDEEEVPAPAEQSSSDPESADTFVRLITTAAEALHTTREESLTQTPGPSLQFPPQSESTSPPVPREPDIKDLPSQTAPAARGESTTVRTLPAPGTRRELPGTYTPNIPITGHSQEGGESPSSPKRQIYPGKSLIISGLLVVIVLIVVCGILIVLPHILPQNNPPITTVTPSGTLGIAPVSGSAETSPTGIEVRVDYPGSFYGLVGNPGYMHPVSGTGSSTFPILMQGNIVQTTIQKPDDSGNAMSVGIYNNNTLITKKIITAPRGEIAILVNISTGLPPGLNETSTGSLFSY